jgi:hypothetical protein
LRDQRRIYAQPLDQIRPKPELPASSGGNGFGPGDP